MISTNHPTTPAATPDGWFKSTFSDNAASCVEVRLEPNLVQIRDSKYRRNPTNNPAHQPIITITPNEWTAFLNGITSQGNIDADAALHVEITTTGSVAIRASRTATALTFTAAEWQAFLNGTQAGEFDHPSLAEHRYRGQS